MANNEYENEDDYFTDEEVDEQQAEAWENVNQSPDVQDFEGYDDEDEDDDEFNEVMPSQRQNQSGTQDQTYENNFYEHTNDDGTVNYQGPLGNFTYDPTQFELTLMNDGEDNTSFTFLKYIGTETDGDNIKIPEGIESTAFMFANSNIKSTPYIPLGVESTFSMFGGCRELEDASSAIPPTVRDAQGMYMNCYNLVKGPSSVPGNVKDMSYMFMDCQCMKNTPKLHRGIERANLAFANCKSITRAPKIPRTLTQHNNMTMQCSALDAQKDKERNADFLKARARYQKRLDKPSFGAQMGSSLSAVMQIYSMHQAGYNLLTAPIAVMYLRKQGQLDNSFKGALAMHMMSRGGASAMMGMQLNRSSAEQQKRKREAKARVNDIKMRRFDAAHENGMGSWQDFQAQKRATKDMKRKVFTKVNNMKPKDLAAHKEIHRARYDSVERMNQNLMKFGSSSGIGKHFMSTWYQKQMAECASYYAEGVQAISENTKYTQQERDAALNGLNEWSKIKLDPLLDSAERMQREQNIFNDGDMRVINKILRNMPSEKENPRSFVQRVGYGNKSEMGNEFHNVYQNFSRKEHSQQERYEQTMRKSRPTPNCYQEMQEKEIARQRENSDEAYSF